MKKINENATSQLTQYLAEEEYPKQFGKIRGFAFAVIRGVNSSLEEDFRSSSAGQGVISQTLYARALDEIENMPGLLSDLDGLIPFPTLVNGTIVTEMVALETAKDRIKKFS